MGFPFRSEKLIKYLTGRFLFGGVFPTDGYIAGVPKNVFRETNSVGNIGTGLDTLRSFTFPPKSFKIDQQDYFKFLIGGGFGSNDDDKRIQLEFGGNVIANTTLLDLDSNGYFWTGCIFRLSVTQVNIIISALSGNTRIDSLGAISSSGSEMKMHSHNILTVNNMDTNNNDFVLKAESATATDNNIINNIWIGEMVRF